jgi:hypothetical protein
MTVLAELMVAWGELPDKENLVVEVRYEIHVRGETKPSRGWIMSRQDASINNKPGQEQNEAATAKED